MTVGSVTAVAADAIAGAQALPVAQPTAQQIARFQNLLQQPAAAAESAQYAAPLSDTAKLNGDLHRLFDYAAQVSGQLRTQLEHRETKIDAQQWPELYLMQEASQEIRGLNVTTLQFQFITTGVEMVNRNTQTLYQV
jgi:hypothetical protein